LAVDAEGFDLARPNFGRSDDRSPHADQLSDDIAVIRSFYLHYWRSCTLSSTESVSTEPAQLLPYTRILDDTCGYMLRVIKVLYPSEAMLVERVGIMAITDLDKNALPPGIQDRVAGFRRMWDSLIKVNATLSVDLDKEGTRTDRCHHTISFDDTPESAEVHFTLDWQRYMTPPHRSPADDRGTLLRDCCNEALRHFQTVGEPRHDD